MKKHVSLALVIAGLFIPQIMKAQTRVTFHTNYGEFVVEMYDAKAPITSGNFLDLVRAKYYDGVIFHRVIKNFMIQGGDPTGTGTGGPGYTIPDEFDESLSNIQKTISMANSGPNTGGSQFFINLVNNTYLDFNKAPLTSKHPVFGIVVSNFSVVQAIGNVAVNGSNRPLTNVVMDSIRINPATTSVKGVAALSEALGIFPNPVKPNGGFNLNSAVERHASIRVFDPMGRLVHEVEMKLEIGANRMAAEFLKVPGVYLLKVSDGADVFSGRVLVAE